MNDAAPAVIGRQPMLVTGGAGFIGCNLADRLAGEGHDVVVYDALTRPGVEGNLEWLRRRHPRRISAVIADVRDDWALVGAAEEASAVFHLAAQVAVTTSMVDPLADFAVNARATVLLLDALRRRGGVPLVFASTNKVYGDLADVALEDDGAAYRPRDPALRAHGVSENRPISFYTPYGCSKGAADQYVLDYARSFGVPATVLRMSCIYGPRQHGTEDQGWLAHFLLRARAGETITLYGNGRQVRDVLFVDDAVDAYCAAWSRLARPESAISGHAFNLGGGPDNAVSLLQVIDRIGAVTGTRVERRLSEWRPGDQRWFVSDNRAVRAALGLRPPIGWERGLRLLAEAYAEEPLGAVT